MVGETIEVKLFVSGFNKAMLRGIEAKLLYDNTILELVGATIYENPNEEEITYLGYINDINALAYSSNVYQYKIAIGLGRGRYVYDGPLSLDDSAFEK